MKNEYEEKFEVEDGKIIYDKHHLFDKHHNVIFDNKYEIQKKLGGGANGITFLGKHKFLNLNQVIKIYFPLESTKSVESKETVKAKNEKNVFEIQKNANIDLNNINAINHDGGEIDFPEKMYYSIMKSVENHITLRNWIKNRDSYFNVAKKICNKNELPLHYVYGESLNMAISLYKNIILKNDYGIVHGDLHVDNILVSNSFPTKEEQNASLLMDEKDFICYFASKNFDNAVGSLKEIPCVFIDMGTSRYSETNRNIGISREINFICENTRKILKPFFSGSKVSFKEIFPYDFDDIQNFYSSLDLAHSKLQFGDYVEKVSESLKKNNEVLNFFTISLSRLVLFYNHMFGFVCGGNVSSIDKNDLNSLNLYVEGEFLRDSLECYDKNLLAALQIISSQDSEVYFYKIINWKKVWDYFLDYFEKGQLDGFKVIDGKMIKI